MKKSEKIILSCLLAVVLILAGFVIVDEISKHFPNSQTSNPTTTVNIPSTSKPNPEH